MTSTARDRGRSAAGVLALLAAVALLHRLGVGPLAAPPLGPGEDLRTWLEARDPVTIGFALFRLGALVLAYHLAITTSVAAIGQVLHRPELVRTATAWTLPPFRSAVRRVVGLGLSAAAALTTPVPVAGAAAPTTTAIAAPGTATLRAVGPEIAVLAPGGAGPATVTLRLAPPPAPDGTATLTDVGTPTRSPEAPTPAPPVPTSPVAEIPATPPTGTPEPTSHIVRPGDHLWRIADDRLAAVLGRPPTDDEVAPYWRRIIDANPQLVDPDLLFVGEAVTVPAP